MRQEKTETFHFRISECPAHLRSHESESFGSFPVKIIAHQIHPAQILEDIIPGYNIEHECGHLLRTMAEIVSDMLNRSFSMVMPLHDVQQAFNRV